MSRWARRKAILAAALIVGFSLAAPSAAQLAGEVTEQLRTYMSERSDEAAYIGPDYCTLTAALEEFVLRGGKRLRPAFA